MLVATCPSCSASYRAEPHNAGRPVRCKACGERFNLPAGSDENDMRWWGAGTPGRPGAKANQPQRPNAPPPSPPPPTPQSIATDEEPGYFANTLKAASAIEAIGVVVFGTAGIVCLVVSLVAFGREGAIAGGVLLGIAVVSLVNIFVVSVAVGAARLLVDIARSQRVLRHAALRAESEAARP
jgi:predicted Zn finger-like uncharacterized protein